jgi:4-amino-4-deoxy-L-arabinose transferase-like glycosyltransferase
MNSEKNPHEIIEPSLLDYLKSRLKFWEHGQKLDLFALEPVSHQPEKGVSPITHPGELEVFGKSPETVLQVAHWPWRSLLALSFALLGQRAFEPSPNRTIITGLVLYGLGFAWLILANLRKEWTLTPYPEQGRGLESLRVQRLPLIFGIGLSLVAFLTLSNNMFTRLNVTLWILAIIFFAWAFWLPGENQLPLWPRIRDFLLRPSWQFKVTRDTLLVLTVVAIVIFFRVYHLGAVPSEPFSDHAEKILDVYDVSQGQTHIFFPRNTGREAIQMYLTLVVSWIFGTGLSFLSLKIGTVFCGLATLPYMYLLGKEFGGRRIGLLAVFFTGIAYWPNIISRAGLRFPLYPLFVAPTLYYLLRGLRTRNRNDFIISGLLLGLGLHGYSPFRIMPLVVVIAVGLYLLHPQSKGSRKHAIIWLSILAITSLIVFLPLARYWFDNPESFGYRAFSRLGSIEGALPAPAWQVFFSNTWNALCMFNWDDGEIWVHSVPHRPALDVVSGALFLIGVLLVLIRYLRQRHWQDLFLLLAVPLLQLPSILSLAFPAENPALNRAAGAMVPTFLLVAIALDGLILAMLNSRPAEYGYRLKFAESSSQEFKYGLHRQAGIVVTWVMMLALAGWSSYQNFDLVFNQFSIQYATGAWNSSEMGEVIQQFGQTYGSTGNAWIVPYPYWVDTRLPGVWAGIPNRDFALWPEKFDSSLDLPGPKLYIVNVADKIAMDQLLVLYPRGTWSHFVSKTKLEGKDFMIFFVPPEQGSTASSKSSRVSYWAGMIEV